MAGSLRILILLAASTVAAPAFSQNSPEQSAAPPPKKSPGAWLGRRLPVEATPSAEFENVRRALDALTPEQRKRFQENFWHWSNLPPEEKKALREREELRKKFMQQEVEVALRETGLNLVGEQRQQFVKRYGDERRKIEEQLRKEANEKRRPLLRDLVARLKAEFSSSTTDSATAR